MQPLPAFELPRWSRLLGRIVSRPLRTSFGISRGSKRYATSLELTIIAEGYVGHGETIPYARYGETLERACTELRDASREVQRENGLQFLLDREGGGCFREALDAARWDWLCKRRNLRIHELLGLELPIAIPTFHTISLDEPATMANEALRLSDFSQLKLKLGGGDGLDLERIRAVKAVRPDARMLADFNEGWQPKEWDTQCKAARLAGLDAFEQPLPAGRDAVLEHRHAESICIADESMHSLEDLEALRNRYDVVNIKLGKCGGLDRAWELAQRATQLGYQLMIGCMVGSSRVIAPALMLAAHAQYVDLDGPLWLRQDVLSGLVFEHGAIRTDFTAKLWG